MTSGPSSPAGMAAAALASDLARTLSQALTDGLAPSALELVDDSASHAGHAGAGAGAHFNVRIVSTRFAGLGRVARHRLVYDCVRPWMAAGVHALAIDARAPDDARTPDEA